MWLDMQDDDHEPNPEGYVMEDGVVSEPLDERKARAARSNDDEVDDDEADCTYVDNQGEQGDDDTYVGNTSNGTIINTSTVNLHSTIGETLGRNKARRNDKRKTLTSSIYSLETSWNTVHQDWWSTRPSGDIEHDDDYIDNMQRPSPERQSSQRGRLFGVGLNAMLPSSQRGRLFGVGLNAM